MKLDPVLAELRKVREAYAEKFAGNVAGMLADLRNRQREGGRKSVPLPPKTSGCRGGIASESEIVVNQRRKLNGYD